MIILRQIFFGLGQLSVRLALRQGKFRAGARCLIAIFLQFVLQYWKLFDCEIDVKSLAEPVDFPPRPPQAGCYVKSPGQTCSGNWQRIGVLAGSCDLTVHRLGPDCKIVRHPNSSAIT
jgi:hypothetical protein